MQKSLEQTDQKISDSAIIRRQEKPMLRTLNLDYHIADSHSKPYEDTPKIMGRLYSQKIIKKADNPSASRSQDRSQSNNGSHPKSLFESQRVESKKKEESSPSFGVRKSSRVMEINEKLKNNDTFATFSQKASKLRAGED